MLQSILCSTYNMYLARQPGFIEMNQENALFAAEGVCAPVDFLFGFVYLCVFE